MGATAVEVEKFLVAYGDALSAVDGPTIASMYEIPGMVISDQGSVAISSPEQVAEFFTAAAAQYTDAGIAGTRPEYVSIEQLSEQICSADVRWIGVDAEGKATRYKEFASYLLRRSEDGTVRIQVAVIRPNDGP
ncbi:hypothetical protein BH10ACT3_BH10ACT3_18600 [soil metagenome]